MEGPVPGVSRAPLILGIRHHGPGSARSVVAALDAARPDVLLIEGPEEASALVPYLLDATPPVAMLFYDVERPRNAVYYPFAEFSPELQAIRWAHRNEVEVRFMDLPASAVLGMRVAREGTDALSRLAEAAGFEDVEDWWEHLVEHRRETTALFEGLEALMAELRSSSPLPSGGEGAGGEGQVEDRGSLPKGEIPLPDRGQAPSPQPLSPGGERGPDSRPLVSDATYERLREDHMRRTLAAAGPNAAVVCGAWHAPALREKPGAKAKLPKVKVAATLVPWTYERLTRLSGYGAGAPSPAFYDQLWTTPAEEVTRHWLLTVARLMREDDLDASPAGVIEAVRLAEALASLRGRPRPGLRELREAAGSVLVRDDAVWNLIGRRLIVGERMGEVPERTPAVPLAADLQATQKRLRMTVDDADRRLELDLRAENDLARSRLFHRLDLLEIPWGEPERVGSGKKGTFHEHWRVRWRPELALAVVEASPWGNTVEAAANAQAVDRAERAKDLPEIAALVETSLLADLGEAIGSVVRRLLDLSATTADVGDLADALPPLVAALRYGSVRRTEAARLKPVVDAILTRLFLGLPGACASLDDEAAEGIAGRLTATASVVRLLDDEAKTACWLEALRAVAERTDVHGRVAGRAERLRFDAGAVTGDELAARLEREASVGAPASETAAFVQGLLEGSGTLLLHQEPLWRAVDDWIVGLPPEAFDETLPLIRRTFALFTRPERRQLGERAAGDLVAGREERGIDRERAERVLPMVRRILGL